jgi:hypothetical protein
MNIDYKRFKKNGFLIIPNFINSEYKEFIDLSDQLELEVKKKFSKIDKSKFGGAIMGNLGVYPGKLGKKIYELCLRNKLNEIVYKTLGKNLNEFHVHLGGNLCLPNSGGQNFHIDGKFNNDVFLFSLATSKITDINGSTEIVSGSHKKNIPFWKFCLSKKNKIKINLDIGDLAIRHHNLWHRGSANKTNKSRFLMTIFLYSKNNVRDHYKVSDNVTIQPNFFKPSLKGKFIETTYAKFKMIYVIYLFLKSFISK